MLRNKRIKSILLVYVIAMIVYIVLAAVIPFSKPAGSWVTFGFSILSFILGAVISICAFDKGSTLVSKFYGYPVFRIGFLYTILQTLISILIFAVGAFTNLPYWIGLSISVLLLGIALIGVITTDNVRDYVNEVDTQNKISIKPLTRFNIDISDIVDNCKDPEVYEALKKLKEKFKYSDQVSSSATEEKEASIMEEIKKLRSIIDCDDKQKIIEQIRLISNLLSNRNQICESAKR